MVSKRNKKWGLISLVTFLIFNQFTSAQDIQRRSWHQNYPWVVQSNPEMLDPYANLTHCQRERTSKRLIRRYLGDEIDERATEIINEYDFLRNTQEKAHRFRDRRLTLKIGEEDLNSSGISRVSNQTGFFLVRPGRRGLEFYGKNPTHVTIKGDSGIRGPRLSINPRYQIPLPLVNKRIPLPEIELRSSWEGEYSFGLGYKINF